jgi:hypothetical protein
VAEFPDPWQEQVVWVSGERKIGEVFYGLKTTGCIEFTAARVTAKDLCYFDVEQTGRMKRLPTVEKSLGYPGA